MLTSIPHSSPHLHRRPPWPRRLGHPPSPGMVLISVFSEEWLIFKLRDNDPIPELGNFKLEIREMAVA
jgi:hypothetical protein